MASGWVTTPSDEVSLQEQGCGFDGGTISRGHDELDAREMCRGRCLVGSCVWDLDPWARPD